MPLSRNQRRNVRQKLRARRVEPPARKGTPVQQPPKRMLDVNTLPDDMKDLVVRGKKAQEIAGLIRRGVYAADSPQFVHECVAFLDSMHTFYSVAIQSHPRFAEFFPEAAQQIAQVRAMREGPGLVGPDGQPISVGALDGQIIMQHGGPN